MDKVDLYILNTKLVLDKYDFVLSFVDTSRKEKALKYLNKKDQLLSLGGSYLLKRYLPKGNIKESINGKPYLEDGPYFNISHSGEYVVLAIHPSRDVGVDIQQINVDKIKTIEYVLNESEKDINDPETLFKIWSNKESLIKCMSSSLKDIRAINGLPLNGKRAFLNNSYYSISEIYDGYSLSITLKGESPFKTNINIIDSI